MSLYWIIYLDEDSFFSFFKNFLIKTFWDIIVL